MLNLVVSVLGLMYFNSAEMGDVGTTTSSDILTQTFSVRIEAGNDMLILTDDMSFDPSLDANRQRAYYGEMSIRDANAFADFTGRHVGEQIRLYVCDTMLVEATLRTQILSGNIMLVGEDGVHLMESFLRNGCP